MFDFDEIEVAEHRDASRGEICFLLGFLRPFIGDAWGFYILTSFFEGFCWDPTREDSGAFETELVPVTWIPVPEPGGS